MDKILSELRMGQSDLERFFNSTNAQKIRMGFEAELCFEGYGVRSDSDDDFDDGEPDYDYDRRTKNIDNILDFFLGDYNDQNTIEDLKVTLTKNYTEWRDKKLDDDWAYRKEKYIRNYILSNEIDYDEELTDYLSVVMNLSSYEVKQALAAGADSEEISNTDQKRLFPEDESAFKAFKEAKRAVEELIKEKIEDKSIVDSARGEFFEENIDEYTESDWLNDKDLDRMSDIERMYNLIWPYWTSSESDSDDEGNEYGYDAALKLASSMKSYLGVSTKVSRNYHSIQRDANSWIFEPDSSIDPEMGDMPVEIISPPMPLKEGIQQMRKFFKWADDNDAYGNRTTGLHVGVSLPSQDQANVDYIKLVLFLGDNYVLDTFNRAGNEYCKSYFNKLLKVTKNSSAFEIESLLDNLTKGLQTIASKALRTKIGNDKYASINIKPDYVEFRSMGGDYLNKIDIIINTILRYAYALSISADVNAEKKEYNKKLYKLLQRGIKNPEHYDIVDIYSKYSTGNIDKSRLKDILNMRAAGRDMAKRQSPDERKWLVRKGNLSIEVQARSEYDAKNIARRIWGSPLLSHAQMDADPIKWE